VTSGFPTSRHVGRQAVSTVRWRADNTLRPAAHSERAPNRSAPILARQAAESDQKQSVPETAVLDNPANKARKAIGQKIRASHLNRRSWADRSSLAAGINPVARGWINYYGAFYRSELRFLAWRINDHLVRWAMKKFKRFRRRYARAFDWLVRVHHYQPAPFAHWQPAPPLRGRPVGAG
jgi:hypothetical protein